jgi:hypothetical protein
MPPGCGAAITAGFVNAGDIVPVEGPICGPMAGFMIGGDCCGKRAMG